MYLKKKGLDKYIKEVKQNCLFYFKSVFFIYIKKTKQTGQIYQDGPKIISLKKN